jgi:hypothetical protein
MAWRDLLQERLRSFPDNPNFASYLACANELLEWRETVDMSDQFWDE